MNKKLIAVAVAGALGVPGVALAQASTVQIYGTVLLNYQLLDSGSGADPRVKTDMMNSHDANIGFKGEEALGGGLAGWFQCESTLDATGASSAAGTAGFCGRNSAFGLKGSFGNFFIGIWDTPMKVAMGSFRPFSTSGLHGMGAQLWNSAASNTINGVGSGGAGTSFTRRQNNLISYALPAMSGFQASVAYSAANEATAQTSGTTASKPRLYGVAGTYTNGPMILGAGYERHRNYNPSGTAAYTGGTDTSWSLGAAYTFGGKFKLSGIYVDMNYEVNGAGANANASLKQTSWGVYGDWNIQGPHRLRAGYTRANDTKGTATGVTLNNYVANAGLGNTGSTHYAIQYAHHFSKRTELNFGYARVDNDALAKYNLQSLGARPTVGQGQNAWAMGVKHTF